MLDLLYAQAVAARRRYYERRPQVRRRLRAPVISIGNVSVGGTGKTPLVIKLAEWLASRGETPAVLTRGYARPVRRDGVVVVGDGHGVVASYDDSGDEPLMIAQAVPAAIVAVCEDRYLAGVLAERRLGATVHVLDDGFQHVQLARDLDVVTTSPGEIPNGRVLPFGRLRESGRAAARADFVVVMDADAAGARTEAWTLGISQAAAARRVIPPYSGQGPVMAFAGIAHPERFFSMLRDAGYPLAATRAYPDHHRYTETDMNSIMADMQSSGAVSLVTTSKDIVRLESRQRYAVPCRPVPMTLEIDGWDALTACVEAAIDRRRSSEVARP